MDKDLSIVVTGRMGGGGGDYSSSMFNQTELVSGWRTSRVLHWQDGT